MTAWRKERCLLETRDDSQEILDNYSNFKYLERSFPTNFALEWLPKPLSSINWVNDATNTGVMTHVVLEFNIPYAFVFGNAALPK